MRAGIVEFPGSGGAPALEAVLRGAGATTERIWHEETSLPDVDALYLPSGASWGDHLRPGAIAARAPVMAAVRDAADAGLPVLGIGNGFQVLTEAGLLPGALLRNDCLHFVCRTVTVVAETPEGSWLGGIPRGTLLELPVAHGFGRWTAPPAKVRELAKSGRLALRYGSGSDPAGSTAGVAGVLNARGNVLGLMPLPERAAWELSGSTDGLGILLAPLKRGEA